MINAADFSKRLQKVMDRNDLNASSFAERINVGRSSISHILSGRNKPSLDFVISVIKEFPEVDLYWLLNGKGNYPKTEAATTPTPSPQTDLPSPSEPSKQPPNTTANPPQSHDLFSDQMVQNVPEQESNQIKDLGKKVQKVILLYDDGSFEYFIN